MSTTSIVNKHNLSNTRVLIDFFQDQSINLLKNLRFDVGEVCHKKLRYSLRLNRLAIEGRCDRTEEQNTIIREELIKKAILSIKEL